MSGAGKVEVAPGYDGEYGKVKIFKEGENRRETIKFFSKGRR